MSKYWAKVVDGLVVKVIVANDDFFETFIDDSAGTWIETKMPDSGMKIDLDSKSSSKTLSAFSSIAKTTFS